MGAFIPIMVGFIVIYLFTTLISVQYINILPNESDQVHLRDAFMFKQGILIHFDILIKKMNDLHNDFNLRMENTHEKSNWKLSIHL